MKIVKGLIKAVFSFFWPSSLVLTAYNILQSKQESDLSRNRFQNTLLDIAIAKFSILPGQSAHSSVNGMSYNTATGREYIYF